MNWTGYRSDRYEFVVVGSDGSEGEKLDGITGGRVTENLETALKSSGSLNYAGESRGWLDKLIRVYLVSTDAAGVTTRVALGTFMTTTPKYKVNAANAEYSIDMYSRLLALQQDAVEVSSTYAAGTNIVSAVSALVTGVGLTVAATPYAGTLASDIVFEAGTSKLDICNQLLAMVNYWSLGVDGMGVVQVKPYVAPSGLLPSWTFRDDENGIFLPDVEVEYDTFDTPNVVTCIASMPDTVLTSTATNADPTSIYSTVSRGRRIVRTERIDSTPSQGDLDTTASRLLAEGMLSVESVYLDHAYVPIALGDVVVFDYRAAGLTRTLTVASRDIELGNGAMTKSRLRWVR